MVYMFFTKSQKKDIIFDPELMPCLVKSLRNVWSCQEDIESRGQNLCLIIASTIRNEETYASFLRELGKCLKMNIESF